MKFNKSKNKPQIASPNPTYLSPPAVIYLHSAAAVTHSRDRNKWLLISLSSPIAALPRILLSLNPKQTNLSADKPLHYAETPPLKYR